MCFAEGFALSTGFVIILVAHLAAVMTHIALGNDLIVSKVSSAFFSYTCISSIFSKNIFRVMINCKSKSSLVLVKVRGIFRTCQLDMLESFIAKNYSLFNYLRKNFPWYTAKNNEISPNFLVQKFCGKAQFMQKFCGNCAFSQYFHIIKLGEISVFYAVIDAWHGSKYAFEGDVISTVRTPISQRRDVA